MTRKIQHQQDNIKGKQESSDAIEYCVKYHGQFNLLHQIHYLEKQDIKTEKLWSHWKLKAWKMTVVN